MAGGVTTETELPWSCVQHTADRIAVVASGPSARGLEDVTIPEGVTVIAVNGAIDRLPRADFFFTLDLSESRPHDRGNRARILDPRPGTTYYAAAMVRGSGFPIPPRQRRPPEATHVLWLKRLHGKGWRRSRSGLSDDPGGINGGNSGFGALGLAYLMAQGAASERRIGLFGVDGDAEAGYAWGEGSPRRLDGLPQLFASAVPQLEAAGIQVVNGSPSSKVTTFARMPPLDAIAWLAS